MSPHRGGRCMRTAIFVYARTTFELESQCELKVFERDRPGEDLRTIIAVPGTLSLDPGIYGIFTSGRSPPVRATEGAPAADFEIATLANDKDDWPEPPPKATGSFGVTHE